MNRIVSTLAAAAILAGFTGAPAVAGSKGFQIHTAGRDGPSSTAPRHRMFAVVDRSQINQQSGRTVSGEVVVKLPKGSNVGPLHRNPIRTQPLWSVHSDAPGGTAFGPTHSAGRKHRPADITLKRGVVGAGDHPDFMWHPVR